MGCAVKWGIDQLLRACCRQKCGGWKRKLFLYSMFHSSVPLGTTQIRWRRLMLFNKQIRGVKTKSLSCTVCFINCLLSEGFKQYAHLSLLCCPAILWSLASKLQGKQVALHWTTSIMQKIVYVWEHCWISRIWLGMLTCLQWWNWDWDMFTHLCDSVS